MKNNKVMSAIILISALIIVNVLIFMILQTYNASRIINIICLNISLVILWISIFTNFKNNDDKYINYFKLPIVIMYSIITIVASTLLIILNPNTVTSTIVIQILIHGIFAIILASNKMADNLTEKSLSTQKNKVDRTREISKQLSLILSEIDDDELFKKVEKIYDSSRSLKINTNIDSNEIDEKILNSIKSLKKAIEDNNLENVDNTLKDIKHNFLVRNEL